MNRLLLEMGTTLLSNGLQILGGCIVALPIYYLQFTSSRDTKRGFLKDIIIMIFAAFVGMILPLNVYGIIPLIVAALAVGMDFYWVSPLLVSNLLFNMQVPYIDPGFIWRTGIPRLILAGLMGIFAGVLLKAVNAHSDNLVIHRRQGLFPGRPVTWQEILSFSGVTVSILLVCLAFGTIVNTLFQHFAWIRLMQILYTTPQTSFIPRFFGGFNVSNPLFLLAITVGATLLDLTKMAALFAVLKCKGISLIAGYFFIWALLLAASMFFIH
jgi:hypothetical protein